MNPKKIAGEKAVEFVTDNMVVGLGTGSTAFFAIQKLGERVQEGLQIKAIATSLASENLARELQIPLTTFAEVDFLDVTIDGADEVDENNNLIKGGGGALLREKVVAYHSKKFLVIVDETKLVERLGKFALPIEIVPFGADLTLKQLQKLGGNPLIRQANGQKFITDNGNLIVDCQFYPIENPAKLNQDLHLIPGVVETGIFLNEMVHAIISASDTGAITLRT
ncbi:ribose-5-phosphate isomerase RpiA [Adhaeribacter aquaticus]|uniref:ribose-5-phosphate isomerase RpiA n=1 Tax=Adhaeribacter aquaticus TaxID=299567 RepID=UPI0003F86683|nr:ribose-5-phosphate isomerase RpiA [Adhaeribacter aquaticus]